MRLDSESDEASKRTDFLVCQALEPKTDPKSIVVATKHALRHRHGGFDRHGLKPQGTESRSPHSALTGAFTAATMLMPETSTSSILTADQSARS